MWRISACRLAAPPASSDSLAQVCQLMLNQVLPSISFRLCVLPIFPPVGYSPCRQDSQRCRLKNVGHCKVHRNITSWQIFLEDIHSDLSSALGTCRMKCFLEKCCVAGVPALNEKSFFQKGLHIFYVELGICTPGL